MNAEKSQTETRLKAIQDGPWSKNAVLAWNELRAPKLDRASLAAHAASGERLQLRKFSDGKSRHEQKLERLLRPHWKRSVLDPKEIKIRASFDEALTELQLYELAVETGYLGLQDVAVSARQLLAHYLWSAGARKYVREYDYVTVSWLATRVNVDLDKRDWHAPVAVIAEERFAAFLAELETWYETPAIELWLDFLDDYTVVGEDHFYFEKLLQGVKPPQKYAEHFSRLLWGAQLFAVRLAQFARTLSDDEKPRYGSFFAFWLAHFFGFELHEHGYSLDDERSDWGQLLLEAADDTATAEAAGQIETIAELRELWRVTWMFLNTSRSG